MPYDEINRDTVHEMVRYFYATIMKDPLLEPFFTQKLGPDVVNGGKWIEHFTQLDNFWLMMMTGKRHGYQGDPFPAHAFLGLQEREPFEHWLKLFKEATNKFFVPELAAKFYKKADILAEQFIDNLGIDDDDEEW
jgi:truncated hemoglobin YjbI